MRNVESCAAHMQSACLVLVVLFVSIKIDLDLQFEIGPLSLASLESAGAAGVKESS